MASCNPGKTRCEQTNTNHQCTGESGDEPLPFHDHSRSDDAKSTPTSVARLQQKQAPVVA